MVMLMFGRLGVAALSGSRGSQLKMILELSNLYFSAVTQLEKQQQQQHCFNIYIY